MSGRIDLAGVSNVLRQLIIASVGQGGANHARDTRAIQMLLNEVPLEEGGPQPRLVVDGVIGPKTIEAIRLFQQRQFGQMSVDGRVDPNGRTLAKLKNYASRETLDLIAHSARPTQPSGRLRLPQPIEPGSKLEIGKKVTEVR